MGKYTHWLSELILGTRFMCTVESPIHQNIKDKIVRSTEKDTIHIFRYVCRLNVCDDLNGIVVRWAILLESIVIRCRLGLSNWKKDPKAPNLKIFESLLLAPEDAKFTRRGIMMLGYGREFECNHIYIDDQGRYRHRTYR